METIDYLEPQTINISHNLLKPLAGLKKASLSKSFAAIQSYQRQSYDQNISFPRVFETILPDHCGERCDESIGRNH